MSEEKRAFLDLEAPPAVVEREPVGDRPPNHDNNPPFPEDHLILSLINLVCCCPWLAIAALIKGSHVKVLHAGGFYRQARESSKAAFLINVVGIVLGTISHIGLGILFFLYFSALFYQKNHEMAGNHYGTPTPQTMA